ncbi:hypothetical protein ABT282_38500 [Streptomyces sp. NPDC000927]
MTSSPRSGSVPPAWLPDGLLYDRICRGNYERSIRGLLLGAGLDTRPS